MARSKPIQEAPALPTRAQWKEYIASLGPNHIPTNQLCVEDLTDWESAKQKLETVKAEETILRNKIFKHFFPNPVEGTNAIKFGENVYKGNYKITRTVDEVKLQSLGQFKVCDVKSVLQMIGGLDNNFDYNSEELVCKVLEIKLDNLIEWKPGLKTTPYRSLNPIQNAIFEMALETKPGMPSLTVETAKE